MDKNKLDYLANAAERRHLVGIERDSAKKVVSANIFSVLSERFAGKMLAFRQSNIFLLDYLIKFILNAFGVHCRQDVGVPSIE